MKVTVGLTTWSEHPSLINNARKKTTLKEYGQHFPVVEVDTFFYALPQLMTVQKWLTVPAAASWRSSSSGTAVSAYSRQEQRCITGFIISVFVSFSACKMRRLRVGTGFSQPDTNTSFPTLASLISWFFVILFKCTVVFQLLLCTILNWPL